MNRLAFAVLRPLVPYKPAESEREAEARAIDDGRQRALAWLASRGITPAQPFKPWQGIARP